jgi:predicted enzyme related to lactoylglutathione lyase
MANPNKQGVTRRKLVKSAGVIAAAAALSSTKKLCLAQARASASGKQSEQNAAVTGISSIWFSITDFERAKRFYEKALGLKPMFVNDTTGVAAYSANSTDPPLFIIKKPGQKAKNKPKTGSELNHGGTVGFNVADAAVMMNRVREFGGSVSDKVSDGTDTKVYTIYDPDGNVLELTEKKKI